MARIPIYQTDWVNITQVFQTIYVDPVTEEITYLYNVTAQTTIDKNKISAVGELVNPETGQVVTEARVIYYSDSPYSFFTTETLATLQSWVNGIDCTKLCTDT